MRATATTPTSRPNCSKAMRPTWRWEPCCGWLSAVSWIRALSRNPFVLGRPQGQRRGCSWRSGAVTATRPAGSWRCSSAKCGLRDKNIDDVRVFENYSLVSVPFSDAESVVSRLNASGRTPPHRQDRRFRCGERRRKAASAGYGGVATAAKARPEANRPESLFRDAGPQEGRAARGAEEFRSERRPRRETAETADDAGERRPVTRSRKKAENDWNASPAGGNDGFDWEAFQRYDDAAAWEKPKRGGGTRSVRRSGRPRHHGPSGCAQTHCRKRAASADEGPEQTGKLRRRAGMQRFRASAGRRCCILTKSFPAFRIKWLYLRDLYAPHMREPKTMY